MKLSRNVLLFILFFPSTTTPPAICKIWEEKGEKYYFEGGLKYYREKNYELALKGFLRALRLSAKNKLTLKYVNAKRNELKIREERGLLNQAIIRLLGIIRNRIMKLLSRSLCRFWI